MKDNRKSGLPKSLRFLSVAGMHPIFIPKLWEYPFLYSQTFTLLLIFYINLFLALFLLLVLSMSREHFLREMCYFSATLLVVFVFVFLFLFSFSNFRGRAAVDIHVILYVTQCDNLFVASTK